MWNKLLNASMISAHKSTVQENCNKSLRFPIPENDQSNEPLVCCEQYTRIKYIKRFFLTSQRPYWSLRQ